VRRTTIWTVAVIAALALTAALAAASASASIVLCSQAESLCATKNILPAGENITLATAVPQGYGHFFIQGPSLPVKCEYAVINSISKAERGKPLPGQSEVGIYNYNCSAPFFKHPVETCKSLTTNAPAETFEATGGGAGVIYLGSKSEPLTISFSCSTTLFQEPEECSYKATSSVPIHFNFNVATIKESESSMSLVSGSGPCGSTGSLDAELFTGSEHPYISSVLP
jgi:hypothetical protein